MRPRRYLRQITLAACLFALALPAQAAAATPDEILSGLAGHVSHGFANKRLSMPELETKLAAGERISVLCGQISMLGQRALQRAGIQSRLIGTFSSQRYDMLDV